MMSLPSLSMLSGGFISYKEKNVQFILKYCTELKKFIFSRIKKKKISECRNTDLLSLWISNLPFFLAFPPLWLSPLRNAHLGPGLCFSQYIHQMISFSPFPFSEVHYLLKMKWSSSQDHSLFRLISVPVFFNHSQLWTLMTFSHEPRVAPVCEPTVGETGRSRNLSCFLQWRQELKPAINRPVTCSRSWSAAFGASLPSISFP